MTLGDHTDGIASVYKGDEQNSRSYSNLRLVTY